MVKLKDLAEYMVAFVNEFGKVYGMTDTQSFRYLWRYGAITGISDCYEAAHTLPFDDVCRTAARICRNNGGTLQ